MRHAARARVIGRDAATSAIVPVVALDLSVLPDEARALIAAQAATIAAQRDALAERDAELAAQRLLLEKVRLQLARLRRMQFGRRSERLAAQADQLELALEDLEAEAGTAAASPAWKVADERAISDRCRPARRPLPDHLPREVVEHAAPDVCPACGGSLRFLGEDATEVLDWVPGRFRVVRHVRPKCSCRHCETVVQAPPPALPIRRGRATAGLLAHDGFPSRKRDGNPGWCRNTPTTCRATLYEIERDIAGRPADQRARIRAARAGPALDALHGWLTATLARVPGRSDLAAAIRYALVRWTELTRYRDDGRLTINNNAAERAIRPLVLGRKNWLFAGSDAGGTRAAAVASLIETARINGIDPETYLRHVLGIIADYPVKRVAELLPWAIPDLDARLHQRSSR